MSWGRFRGWLGGDGGWLRTVLKVLGVAALVVVLFATAYLGVKALAGMVNRALGGDRGSAGGASVEVVIPAGSSASEIGRLLAGAGVIESASEFERTARVQSVSNRLQAGTYQLETGMNLDSVIVLLVEGPGGEVVRVTVLEGLTVEQMLASLAEQTGYSLDRLRAPLLDGTVTSDLLAHPAQDLSDWEGLLFPDTYEIYANDRPAKVLQLLADTAELKVASVDWAYLTARGLTVYDGIIIASMIEREARFDEERPLMASVVYNRLDIDMPLQIDATIVYALGGSAPTGLTLDDLKIDSPYNTYTNKGLPPTPIAGVRLASLRAAATPAATDYLYYVLKDSEGHHAFTASFDEFLLLQEQARQAGVLP
jgi:UPF0755 protein